MLKKERHEFVVKQVNLHSRLLTNDLAQLLNVSEDTIRRDLKELSEDNLIFKVHGGAMSKAYLESNEDHTICIKKPQISIAEKIIPIIKDGMVILMDGGEVVIELVKQLPETLIATFFTISPLVAVELTKFQNLEVILIGGFFSKDSKITYGGHVIKQVSEINADLCLVEASGIDPKGGISDAELEISKLKSAMFNAAQKSAILCYAEKLNISLKKSIAKWKDIDYLVTDLHHDDKQLDEYHAVGLSVL